MKYSHSKRCFDLLVSLCASLILWPMIVLIALVVLIGDGWPLIYTQKRAGFKGKAFTLYKFRTMKPVSGDVEGDNDALRITSLGYWLRQTSLDELPQLWNVIRGDMSLVGPRPLPMTYVDRYSYEQKQRLMAMPGITGWAQINGRNTLSWNEKFILDTWYVKHVSFWLDVKILFLTVLRVMQRKGIMHDSAEPDTTMPEFLGEKVQPNHKNVED
ncbi:sugar transferase [Kistimonas asteriae]|uniref:sugar transferase n=1 Tax=Kistimonas asteriae TaxID=517724 RepID=UPI001BAB5A74|nr:sugar transferase [Kistimonas asteriae]